MNCGPKISSQVTSDVWNSYSYQPTKACLTHCVPAIETLKYSFNITLLNTCNLLNDTVFPREMCSQFKEGSLRTQLSHPLASKRPHPQAPVVTEDCSAS